MSGTVVVACCQLELSVGDVAGNLAAAQVAVRDVARRGAQLVVLPELLASGYVFADADEARAMAEDPRSGATAAALVALAAELDLVLVAGVCELEPAPTAGHLLRNSALVVDATGVRAVYRKAHLWNTEKLIFTPGDAPPVVVDTAVGRLAVMVCYDLEFPEWVRLAALAGADVVCVPANWPRPVWPDGERPGEVVRAQAAAGTNHVYVAVCDRAGAERGVEWIGGSVVVDPDGYPLATAWVGRAGDPSAPTALLATITPSAARDKSTSARNDALADRRPELYGAVADR